MSRDVYRRNCQRVRENFEGREALYVEKGALVVRVTGISDDPDNRTIEAVVDEVPTLGLRPSLIHERFFPGVPGPISWSISAGFLSTFSEHTWSVGYGGWFLTTAPEILCQVVALAATFEERLSPEDRFGRIMEHIYLHPIHEEVSRVFPDDK
ncbi:MAG: hypothetical protein HYS61_09160 [Acidobacteria bacterium]|nr:hypothetical protein [Acidobacteriota bacterium]